MSKKINVREHLEDGEIDLSMLNLQEVPVRDIAAIKRAIGLDLSNNRLTTLGKNFSTLKFLQKLDLSCNLLTKLPDNFGELNLLKRLDLYNNKLNHLPLSFGDLKNLKWLDLKGNPLVPALADIAGTCLDDKQCQECARRVVKTIGDAKARLEEEQQRAEQARKEQDMAEKIAAKKEQQKSKKAIKNERKKNAENGVKNAEHSERSHVQKKDKQNKTNKTVVKKSSGSVCGSFFKMLFYLSLIGVVLLHCLYVVDIEKFHQLQNGAGEVWNKTVDALPVPVVETGRQAVDLASPTVVNMVAKFRTTLNSTSTFLNTDERVKNHWQLVRSVFYVMSERISILLRTVYKEGSVYYNQMKSKVL